MGPHSLGSPQRRIVALVSAGALVTSGVLVAGPASADTPVRSWAQLQSAFTVGGTVTLGADITAPSGGYLTVSSGTPVTLDLYGFTLQIDNNVPQNDAAIMVGRGANFTVADTSTGGNGGMLGATGGASGAGVGGGNGGSAGSVTVSGGTVDATGGAYAAGVGGGGNYGAGGSLTMSGGTLHATGGGYSAGVGGGEFGSGGSVTMSGGTLVATGGQEGAGVGGGSYGAGGSVTVSGGTLNATGGGSSAGVGGGYHGAGGSVTVSGGTLNATGAAGAAGVGGGYYGAGGPVTVSGGTLDATGGQNGAGVGGGFGGAGGAVTVGAGGSVTAVAGSQAPSAVGAGHNPSTSVLGFGSLSNAGSLTVPSGPLLVPSGVTVDNSGTLTLGNALPASSASLSGAGSVTNPGSIVTATAGSSVAGDGQGPAGTALLVTGHNFDLSFNTEGATSATPADLQVYAATLTAGGQTLPSAPTPAPGSKPFAGWFTAQSGGAQITNTTDLSGLPAVSGPSSATLYAQYRTQPQTITFATPSPATGTVAAKATVSATGGGSGNPVELSVGGSSVGVCSLPSPATSGATVTYLSAGRCTIDASQAGTAYYAPGAGSLDIAVSRAATTVGLVVDPASGHAVYGQRVTATATVTGTGAGSVQFSVDTGASPQDVGGPVEVSTTNGVPSATSPPLTGPGGSALPVGATQVGATFVPSDQVAYAGSTANPVTVTVAAAATTTTPSVASRSVSAAIRPVAPGAGTVSGGTVTFEVDGTPIGTATASGGSASLAYTLNTVKGHTVRATYSGGTDYAMSTGSISTTGTGLRAPSITAHETSAHAKSRYGWYRSAVTVRFTCTTHGAPLTGACPAPVTLTKNGARQRVSRQVTSVDGGTASVKVSINLDRTAPRVSIIGLPASGRAHRLPHPSCRASDTLSGLASCRLTHTTRHHRDSKTVTYTATATDRAGNTTTVRRALSIT